MADAHTLHVFPIGQRKLKPYTEKSLYLESSAVAPTSKSVDERDPIVTLSSGSHSLFKPIREPRKLPVRPRHTDNPLEPSLLLRH